MNGEKLSDEEELKIEKYFDKITTTPIMSKSLVSYKKFDINMYQNFLKDKFKQLNLFGIKVLIDCANGSVYKFAVTFSKNLVVKLFVILTNLTVKTLIKIVVLHFQIGCRD